ncbi:MAG: hypothetical protein EA346_08495 [Thioalkalivibrio sp.]|nr:MAG: hypothetical protein EA346_08495 [Thioalkalivibrio sp.]
MLSRPGFDCLGFDGLGLAVHGWPISLMWVTGGYDMPEPKGEATRTVDEMSMAGKAEPARPLEK